MAKKRTYKQLVVDIAMTYEQAKVALSCSRDHHKKAIEADLTLKSGRQLRELHYDKAVYEITAIEGYYHTQWDDLNELYEKHEYDKKLVVESRSMMNGIWDEAQEFRIQLNRERKVK